MTENEIGTKILDAAFLVHRELGPGLLESAYQKCLLAQLLTYIKLTGCKLGYLINFNTRILKDGIKRVALGL